MQNILIVGSGAAGVGAAEGLRRNGFGGDIALLGDEPDLPYDRPPLSKQILNGSWEPERALLRTAAEYEKLDVRLLPERRAHRLHPDERSVELATGERLPYDGLIIATGVAARRLPEGHELTGVHVLREIGDAAGLRADLARSKRVVVIGAGLIGTEVAATARKQDLDVTVVDPERLPMLRQVGPQIAGHIAELHRSHGVELLTGVGVSRLIGSDGAVREVELTDGALIPADCVVVAIGSVPATGWLSDSGLPVGNGVECDEYCRVAPDIYAAGDVASWWHPGYGQRMRVEHRMNATEQAVVAAENLLGGQRSFAPTPYFWTDQYNVKIQAHGILAPEATVDIVDRNTEDGRFIARYSIDTDLVGVLAWNHPRKLRDHLPHLVQKNIAAATAAS